MVIENRGGAGGNIGQAVAAQAPADGYTTLFTGNGIAISDLLFRNPGFDWKKDLQDQVKRDFLGPAEFGELFGSRDR